FLNDNERTHNYDKDFYHCSHEGQKPTFKRDARHTIQGLWVETNDIDKVINEKDSTCNNQGTREAIRKAIKFRGEVKHDRYDGDPCPQYENPHRALNNLYRIIINIVLGTPDKCSNREHNQPRDNISQNPDSD